MGLEETILSCLISNRGTYKTNGPAGCAVVHRARAVLASNASSNNSMQRTVMDVVQDHSSRPETKIRSAYWLLPKSRLYKGASASSHRCICMHHAREGWKTCWILIKRLICSLFIIPINKAYQLPAIALGE